MKELLEEFKSGRAALYAATGKRPSRYPNTLRQLAVAYSSAARSGGARPGVVARDLGIDPITLAAWEKRTEVTPKKAVRAPQPALRPVVIIDDPPESGATLCVIGPRGLRLEGATIEQVAALFQRLAC
jgi:hypothetical protein